MNHRQLMIVASMSCVVASAPVVAFSQETPPLVDRAVADLDPLAASFRRIDPAYGDNLNRERVRILQPGDTAAGLAPTYGIEGPGYRATFNRPDYITLSADGVALNRAPIYDGAYIDVIPPNTVFDLTNPTLLFAPAPLSPEALRLRVDTRIGQGNGSPYFTPASSLTPLSYSIPDNTEPGKAMQLQPWVTAEDLRQPSGLEENMAGQVVPNRVIRPGDPETRGIFPIQATPQRTPDSEMLEENAGSQTPASNTPITSDSAGTSE